MPPVLQQQRQSSLNPDLEGGNDDSQGVQVGTRFIATRECITRTNYKDIIVHTEETGTGLVDIDRFRIRALHTPLVEK
jgi:NAD(P)H-dependent flavin oxidoreductase YrpB (nitropropane dioxygenase family)